jgi:hypothetical protein
MSQNPDNIESALRAGFFEALPQAVNNTALENVPFDPAGKELYFAFHYLPAEASVATLGAGGTDLISGIVQIDINIKNGEGKGSSEQLIKTLRDYFTAGKRLLYNTVSVIVMSSGRAGRGNSVGSHYRFSFQINFESRIQR